MTGALFAQVKVQGIVKDSLGAPLELANIIAINQQTNKLDSYAITDSNGRYFLTLSKESLYKIQVSYIGMKTAQAEIVTASEDINKDFTLVNDSSLDEVEIKYQMPVTIKNDTIIYDADSFKTGSEKKLEDVLKKLPGVEIDDDGQIEVEGKKVSKVMVEGKDFFDGDSKLASKNIPSNAVDKVEVLKNYSEINQLSGVTNNQDNVALNIRLKKGKDKFWFGDITAGAGTFTEDGLYLTQPKLFYYSPKFSANFIGDLNNIGEVAFTRRDFFNFMGGFRRPSRSSGTSINLGGSSLNFLTMQNNRAKEVISKLGAFNFSYSPKSTLDLSGFIIFTGSRIDMQEVSSITYLQDGLGGQNEQKESNTRQRSDLVVAKLSAKYKPDLNHQLNYDVLARTSKESQDQNIFSSLNGSITELEKSTPYSINQNLNYYYTLNDKNIFAFEAQHLLQDEDPFYNAVLENKDDYMGIAGKVGFDLYQLGFDIAQEKRVQSNQLDAKLDYWNVLNLKSNINFTLGTIYSKQKYQSDLFQLLDNGSTFNPHPEIADGLATNFIFYDFSDVYLGVHYRFKTGIFTITPGFSTHTYGITNSQFGVKSENNFFRVLPDFNMRIELKKSESINLDYSMQTQFTDVNQFAMALVMNGYNSFFSGNPELENALSHNVNLSYFSFNMFNYTNVFANINYNKTIDRIRTSSVLDDKVIRISSPINSQFADESLSANGNFERRFGKFQARVNGNFSYNKFNQLINGENSVNENYNQSYGARLRTNFREAPNVSLNYRYSISNNPSANTTYYTKTPSIELDAFFWKSFTFLTDFSFTNFSDKQKTLREYKFWNTSLSYRKNNDSKWEYELKATNLLGTRSQNNTSSNDFMISAVEYYIQPRFVTFRLKYNL